MPNIKKSALTVQKPFPILRLPPEIRNRIWRYVLIKDEDIVVCVHGRRQRLLQALVPSRLRFGKEIQGHKEDDERRINSTQLALALTSRQLYLEAALIYYSENTFHFLSACRSNGADSMLEKFTTAIGSQNAGSITAGRFHDIHSLVSQDLSVLPGLKQLTVTSILVYPPFFGFWDLYWHSILSMYAEIYPSVVIKHHGIVWGLQH